MEKSKVKQMVKQMVKEVPKILALDLGTTTGWAIWQQREPSASYQVCSGTISLKNDRFQGGGMRYLRFRNWLDDLNYNREITSVYFEEVRRHIGTDAAHVYGGFLGTLTAWCEDHNLPYQSVPVSHIKRQVTGKGNASKQEVIEAVRALGYRPKDDNEADALAIIEWVLKGAS
jgi:Holliday junction resolvasome RuvABC endonuclease subunit